MILCWYSADCLKDPDCIHAVISICQKFWPTIGADAELKNVFIKMLMFLTSNSLPGKIKDSKLLELRKLFNFHFPIYSL